MPVKKTIDLFLKFPEFYAAFKVQKAHRIIRLLFFFMLVVLIFEGLLGPQDPSRNFMLYLCWGLWWPGVVLSWFFVGRMWCGLCPFPELGRVFQYFHLTAGFRVPKFIVKNNMAIAMILLTAILLVEESTRMYESPRESALLLLFILGGATFCVLMFGKQQWCVSCCPLGRMIGFGASISLLEFRPDHDKCRQCKTFACKKGTEDVPGCPVSLGAFNIVNSLECHVCGHCLQLCPHDSPQLRLRQPLNEIILRKGKYITCTYIIPILMGSQLARILDQSVLSYTSKIQATCTSDVVCEMGLYLIPFVLAIILVYMIISLGDLLFGVYHDDLLGSFSPMVPVLFPVAFAGELVHRLTFAVRNAYDFFPTVGREFGWTSLESWTFVVPEWVYPAIALPIMMMGQIGALYVLDSMVFGEFEGLIAPWRYHTIQIVFILMFAIYISLISMSWDIETLNVLHLLHISI